MTLCRAVWKTKDAHPAVGANPLNAVAFDTHAFIKRLTAVGMPEPQAEALADEQVRLIDDRLATKEDIAKLGAEIARLEAATRTDIARLESSTKNDIAQLEASTKAEFARAEAATKAEFARLEAASKAALAETKADILKWVSGMMGFQTIVILGAVFGLARLFVH